MFIRYALGFLSAAVIGLTVFVLQPSGDRDALIGAVGNLTDTACSEVDGFCGSSGITCCTGQSLECNMSIGRCERIATDDPVDDPVDCSSDCSAAANEAQCVSWNGCMATKFAFYFYSGCVDKPQCASSGTNGTVATTGNTGVVATTGVTGTITTTGNTGTSDGDNGDVSTSGTDTDGTNGTPSTSTTGTTGTTGVTSGNGTTPQPVFPCCSVITNDGKTDYQGCGMKTAADCVNEGNIVRTSRPDIVQCPATGSLENYCLGWADLFVEVSEMADYAYTTVTNIGGQIAYNNTITFDIPGGFAFGGSSSTFNHNGASCTVVANRVTCSVLQLASGQSISVGVPYKATSGTCEEEYPGTVSARTSSTEPNTSNNSAEISYIGGECTYPCCVRDDEGAYLECRMTTDDGCYNAEPSGTWRTDFSQCPAAGSATNPCLGKADLLAEYDLNSLNLFGIPDSQSASASVENIGGEIAQGVSFVINVPAPFAVDTSLPPSASVGTCTATANQVRCTPPQARLASGEYMLVHFTYKATSAATSCTQAYPATATASTSTPEDDTANNVASVAYKQKNCPVPCCKVRGEGLARTYEGCSLSLPTACGGTDPEMVYTSMSELTQCPASGSSSNPCLGEADLEVSYDGDEANRGSATATVKNIGGEAAENVTFKIELPDGFAYDNSVPIGLPGCVPSGTGIACSSPRLESQYYITVNFRYKTTRSQRSCSDRSYAKATARTTTSETNRDNNEGGGFFLPSNCVPCCIYDNENNAAYGSNKTALACVPRQKPSSGGSWCHSVSDAREYNGDKDVLGVTKPAYTIEQCEEQKDIVCGTAPVDISITKEVDGALVYKPGDKVTYTLKVKNNGSSPAQNVRLIDQFTSSSYVEYVPAESEVGEAICTAGGAVGSLYRVSCNFGSNRDDPKGTFAPGEERTVKLTFTILPRPTGSTSCTLDNFGFAYTDSPDTDSKNNSVLYLGKVNAYCSVTGQPVFCCASGATSCTSQQPVSGKCPFPVKAGTKDTGYVTSEHALCNTVCAAVPVQKFCCSASTYQCSKVALVDGMCPSPAPGTVATGYNTDTAGSTACTTACVVKHPCCLKIGSNTLPRGADYRCGTPVATEKECTDLVGTPEKFNDGTPGGTVMAVTYHPDHAANQCPSAISCRSSFFPAPCCGIPNKPACQDILPADCRRQGGQVGTGENCGSQNACSLPQPKKAVCCSASAYKCEEKTLGTDGKCPAPAPGSKDTGYADTAACSPECVRPTADLVVTKAMTAADKRPGGIVEYTITVKNTSLDTAATGIGVYDVFPTGLTIATYGTPQNDACSMYGSALDCPNLTIPANGEKRIKLSFTINTPNQICGSQGSRISRNEARISGMTAANNASTSNDYAYAPEFYIPCGKWEVSKRAVTPAPFKKGQRVTYELTFTRLGADYDATYAGGSDTYNEEFIDESTQLTFLPSDGCPVSDVAGKSRITCQMRPTAKDQSYTVTVQADVKDTACDPKKVVNTVRVLKKDSAKTQLGTASVETLVTCEEEASFCCDKSETPQCIDASDASKCKDETRHAGSCGEACAAPKSYCCTAYGAANANSCQPKDAETKCAPGSLTYSDAQCGSDKCVTPPKKFCCSGVQCLESRIGVTCTGEATLDNTCGGPGTCKELPPVYCCAASNNTCSQYKLLPGQTCPSPKVGTHEEGYGIYDSCTAQCSGWIVFKNVLGKKPHVVGETVTYGIVISRYGNLPEGELAGYQFTEFLPDGMGVIDDDGNVYIPADLPQVDGLVANVRISGFGDDTCSLHYVPSRNKFLGIECSLPESLAVDQARLTVLVKGVVTTQTCEAPPNKRTNTAMITKLNRDNPRSSPRMAIATVDTPLNCGVVPVATCDETKGCFAKNMDGTCPLYDPTLLAARRPWWARLVGFLLGQSTADQWWTTDPAQPNCCCSKTATTGGQNATIDGTNATIGDPQGGNGLNGATATIGMTTGDVGGIGATGTIGTPVPGGWCCNATTKSCGKIETGLCADGSAPTSEAACNDKAACKAPPVVKMCPDPTKGEACPSDAADKAECEGAKFLCTWTESNFSTLVRFFGGTGGSCKPAMQCIQKPGTTGGIGMTRSSSSAASFSSSSVRREPVFRWESGIVYGLARTQQCGDFIVQKNAGEQCEPGLNNADRHCTDACLWSQCPVGQTLTAAGFCEAIASCPAPDVSRDPSALTLHCADACAGSVDKARCSASCVCSCRPGAMAKAGEAASSCVGSCLEEGGVNGACVGRVGDRLAECCANACVGAACPYASITI